MIEEIDPVELSYLNNHKPSFTDLRLDDLENAIYNKMPKINYAMMYEKLKSFRENLEKDPTEFGIAPINYLIQKIQEHKSDITNLILDGIKNKDRWQRAYKAVWSLYNSRLAERFQIAEVKDGKNIEERKMKALETMGREVALVEYVERHYSSGGNREVGEAINYLSACWEVKGNLESLNSNLNLQVRIIDYMMQLKEITSESIKEKQDMRKKMTGERVGPRGLTIKRTEV
jgi:hypothetical protein